MEDRPSEERTGPRPESARERLNERLERMGERVEEGAEEASSWMSGVADWLMAPPFLPREARRHLIAARREALLAVRSVIDRSIERTDDAERRTEPPKATKIEID